jgi:hypothetical protein
MPRREPVCEPPDLPLRKGGELPQQSAEKGCGIRYELGPSQVRFAMTNWISCNYTIKHRRRFVKSECHRMRTSFVEAPA